MRVGCSQSDTVYKWSRSLLLHCAAQSRGVSSHILNTKYSIGYISSSEARDSALPDARLLNHDNHWVRPSVTTIQAAMDNISMDLGKRLTGSLVNAPGILSYPIAGYTYILIRKTTMANCTLAMELYRMFSYLLEDKLAQSIVAESINAPLSAVVLKQVKQRALDGMQCQGVSVKDLVAIATSIENGSNDAWRSPVIIVCALLGAALVMLVAFFLYVKYTQNRSARRSTFVIELDVLETAVKSVGPLPTVSVSSMNSSKNSKTGTYDTVEWVAGAGLEWLKVTSGEQFLARKLCVHLLPETMQWAAKVTLVKMKEKISHPNLMKLMGFSLHDNQWKLINSCPSKGRLQDILHAGKYHLDAVFRYSILMDTAEGMGYLHKNGIVHGQLTSNSCYIDARWNVVVGDWEQYALHQAQRVQFVAFEAIYNEVNLGTLKVLHFSILLASHQLNTVASPISGRSRDVIANA